MIGDARYMTSGNAPRATPCEGTTKAHRAPTQYTPAGEYRIGARVSSARSGLTAYFE